MELLLLGVDALVFLEKEGFPVLRSHLARNEDEVAAQASETGFPVTLKISSLTQSIRPRPKAYECPSRVKLR